jgi:hypothetical protein
MGRSRLTQSGHQQELLHASSVETRQIRHNTKLLVLKLENSFRVLAGDALRLIGRQRVDSREAARHVADIVRII